MIQLFILSIGVAALCAVLDFVVDEYCNGYWSIMKTFREFLIFSLGQIFTELMSMVSFAVYSSIAGGFFLLGCALMYRLVLNG